MSTYKFARLNIQEAEYLADLSGIKQDLNGVLEFCNFYKSIRVPDVFGVPYLEMCSIAILSKYSRPFSKGVRRKFDKELLEKLTPQQIASHQYFIDWRNKHIAHSVNPFEDNQAVACYADEKRANGFTSISVQNTHLVGLNPAQIEEISELTQILLTHLETKIKGEELRVLELARKLDFEQILLADTQSYSFPPPLSVSKPRK